MVRVFRWFRDMVQRYRRWRHAARVTAPQNLRATAEDLRHLAELAERTEPIDAMALVRLRRIQREMLDISAITLHGSFHRLSQQERLELLDTLERSRDQILDAMQAGDSPTQRIQ